MSAQDRQRAIEHLLSQSGELHLTDLASRFQVSEMTIRRDLGTLEDRGVLRRVVGGGAIAAAQKAHEPSFTTRALDESSSKAHIGVAVANLLEAGEAIYLDGGSTALAVARAIRGRDLGLTVVTRNLFAALELADEPRSQVILLGGRIKSGEMVTTRTGFDQDIDRYNVDSYVMEISSANPVRGLTDYDPEEAVTKRQAIDCATESSSPSTKRSWDASFWSRSPRLTTSTSSSPTLTGITQRWQPSRTRPTWSSSTRMPIPRHETRTVTEHPTTSTVPSNLETELDAHPPFRAPFFEIGPKNMLRRPELHKLLAVGQLHGRAIWSLPHCDLARHRDRTSQPSVPGHSPLRSAHGSRYAREERRTNHRRSAR